jgi:hypothetical protein
MSNESKPIITNAKLYAVDETGVEHPTDFFTPLKENESLMIKGTFTTTKDKLLECEVCGAADFCITQELPYSCRWIRCRQCDKVFGLAHKTIYEGSI